MAAADPLPPAPAARVRAASTSARVTSEGAAGSSAAESAADSAAHPIPSFSWGTTPQRYAVASSISSGGVCDNSSASSAILSRRLRVAATRREVSTSSASFSGELRAPD